MKALESLHLLFSNRLTELNRRLRDCGALDRFLAYVSRPDNGAQLTIIVMRRTGNAGLIVVFFLITHAREKTSPIMNYLSAIWRKFPYVTCSRAAAFGYTTAAGRSGSRGFDRKCLFTAAFSMRFGAKARRNFLTSVFETVTFTRRRRRETGRARANFTRSKQQGSLWPPFANEQQTTSWKKLSSRSGRTSNAIYRTWKQTKPFAEGRTDRTSAYGSETKRTTSILVAGVTNYVY